MTEQTEPLDALRQPTVRIQPDPGFAARLRERLERELLADPPTPEVTMTETLSPTAAVSPAEAEALTLHTVTPYLAVSDARAALEFYAAAFGAVPRGQRYEMPDGRLGHAELAFGDSVLMLADEYPEIGHVGPTALGGSPVSLRLEVPDPDAVVAEAVRRGATLERAVVDQPYGRGGVVLDPYGHRWMVSRAPARPAPLRTGDVGYVSLWTADVAAAERFYRAVLGWRTTGGSGPQGRQVTNAGSPVGMWGGQERSTTFCLYTVPDVDAAVGVVRAAGGTAAEPTDEPYGRTALCTDDQGLPFGLSTPPPGPADGRHPLVEEGERSGEVVYLTVQVPDATRARAFYGTVLGWGFTPGRVADGWGVRVEGSDARPMTGLAGGHDRACVVPMFTVPDLDAALAAVAAAGGAAGAVDPQPYGRSAECADDQGTPFYLLEG